MQPVLHRSTQSRFAGTVCRPCDCGVALPLQSGPPGNAPLVPCRAVPCAPECVWIGDGLSFPRMRRLRDGAAAPGPPLICVLDVTLALLGAWTALAQLSMSYVVSCMLHRWLRWQRRHLKSSTDHGLQPSEKPGPVTQLPKAEPHSRAQLETLDSWEQSPACALGSADTKHHALPPHRASEPAPAGRRACLLVCRPALLSWRCVRVRLWHVGTCTSHAETAPMCRVAGDAAGGDDTAPTEDDHDPECRAGVRSGGLSAHVKTPTETVAELIEKEKGRKRLLGAAANTGAVAQTGPLAALDSPTIQILEDVGGTLAPADAPTVPYRQLCAWQQCH